MNPHTGIRVTNLVLAGVGMTAVAWVGLRWFESSSGMPDPGWVGLAAMLFLAGGLLVAGWQVRQVRDGRAERHLSPLRAARTLVLGQAAALTGAVLAGWYLASVLVLLPDSDVDTQRGRMWPFVLHAVVAVGLGVAGMVVQRWCRIRPRDDEDIDNNHA